jgi:hypothetical protein
LFNPCYSREEDRTAIQKLAESLIVMPDLIPAQDGIFDRHPET